MESNHAAKDAPPPAPADAATGRVERWLLWLGASGLAGVAIAWLAVQLQAAGVAPVLLMPVVVGIALGLVMEGLAGLAGVRPSRAWLAVAGGGALLLIAAQSYFGYAMYRRDFAVQEQANPKFGLFRGTDKNGEGEQNLGPAGFVHYMESRLNRSPGWPLWTADACLTLAGAVGWTAWRLRARRRETRPAAGTDSSNSPSNPPLAA